MIIEIKLDKLQSGFFAHATRSLPTALSLPPRAGLYAGCLVLGERSTNIIAIIISAGTMFQYFNSSQLYIDVIDGLKRNARMIILEP